MPKKTNSVSKKPSTTSKKSNSSLTKITLLLLVAVLLIIGFFASGIPQQQNKLAQLKRFYADLVQAEQTSNYQALYDSLTYEQKRVMSYEMFAAEKDLDERPISMDFTIHSVKVDGNRGLIDRTLVACFSEVCTGEDRFEQRAIKEYLFINGQWYTPENNDVDEDGIVIDQNWPTVSPMPDADSPN